MGDSTHNYFYRDKHKIIKESSYTDCHWLLITEDKMMGDEEKLVLRLDLPCLTFSHKCPLASHFLLHGLLQQLHGEPSPWFKWASGPDTLWSNCLPQSLPHRLPRCYALHYCESAFCQYICDCLCASPSVAAAQRCIHASALTPLKWEMCGSS